MSVVNQLEMDTRTPEEREAEHEAELDRAEQDLNQLFALAREAVIAHGGFDAVANQLDKIWGDQRFGRPVSSSTFKATIAKTTERNYFRVEWIFWLVENSPAFAAFLHKVADGRTRISAEEEVENLHALLDEYTPKSAAEIKRKARSMRRRRGGR